MAAKKDTSRDDIHTLDSTTAGEVKLAEDVVASIAAIAAGEVEGVSAMTGNFSDRLKHSVGIRTGAGTGVRVIIAGNMVRVDIALVLKYGHNAMTGLNVTDVNIRITGVNSEVRSDK